MELLFSLYLYEKTLKLIVMRDYSIPPFSIGEMAAVYTGLCNAINEECPTTGMSSNPRLAMAINVLSNKYNSPKKATGDFGQTGIALQSLIETILKNDIVKKNTLEEFVHVELSKLPISPFVDYFTGKTKV